ncbi:MAG: hypothetical protein IJP93_03200 [Bacteroidales bacterium]|nr:hypothetical protein [Bacteroidales bacterium]
MSEPIWKDYSITLETTGASTRYSVYYLDGEQYIIHQGMAYQNPETGIKSIKLNDICRPFLGQAFPGTLTGFHALRSIERIFFVDTLPGPTAAGQVTFQNDWSYDRNFTPSTRKSFPIVPILDPRQILIFSVLPTGNLQASITAAGGQSPVAYADAANAPGNAVLNLRDYTLPERVEITGTGMTTQVFEVRNSCQHRYVIYYVNAYGGWDSLLLYGDAVRTDSYSRKSFASKYNNAEMEFGKVNYMNTIGRRWELRTDWLTDDQASNMHHLLGTNMAVLCDLQENAYYPVNITDQECVYKTYRNGRKMPSYTINVEYAQDIIRR